MTEQSRTGEQPNDRDVAESTGAPSFQTPADGAGQSGDQADLVTEDDGSGMSGGSSGGSGGGSSMPGHPDAAR